MLAVVNDQSSCIMFGFVMNVCAKLIQILLFYLVQNVCLLKTTLQVLKKSKCPLCYLEYV